MNYELSNKFQFIENAKSITERRHLFTLFQRKMRKYRKDYFMRMGK